MSRMPVSHSRLSAFDKCPAHFKAIYIDKVPQIKGVHLLVGGFFHDWAEKYVKHCVQAKTDSDHDAGARIFERMWDGRDTHKEFKDLPEAKYGELSGLVQSFLESHALPYLLIAGIEIQMAFDEDWKPCGWQDPQVFFLGACQATGEGADGLPRPGGGLHDKM